MEDFLLRAVAGPRRYRVLFIVPNSSQGCRAPPGFRRLAFSNSRCIPILVSCMSQICLHVEEPPPPKTPPRRSKIGQHKVSPQACISCLVSETRTPPGLDCLRDCFVSLSSPKGVAFSDRVVHGCHLSQRLLLTPFWPNTASAGWRYVRI